VSDQADPNSGWVLALDSDAPTRRFLEDYFGRRGYRVECWNADANLHTRLRTGSPPEVVLADTSGWGVSFEALLGTLRSPASAPLIAISEVVRYRASLRFLRGTNTPCIVKPLHKEDLDEAIDDALAPAARKSLHEAEVAPDNANDCFRYSSHPKVTRIREIARRVAKADAPILISGESGVGKGVLARHLHHLSAHREGQLVSVNCAALPSDLLESELFGYERGAFTGAADRKTGKFEQAEDGTIFLDEIAEMRPSLQAKLLHVLQDREFARLGGTRTLKTNARVIAATNQNLHDAVSSGGFREDLYYRLNVVHIEMPPLREHLSDVPALCAEFLAKYTSGKTRVRLSDRVMRAFSAYPWPGNIRQLENMVRQFVIFQDEEYLLEGLRQRSPSPAATPSVARIEAGSASLSLKHVGAQAAEQAERQLVMRLLEERRWNRKQVARDLKVSYKTLLLKLQRWDKSA
jgi:DNA-binding NtrC family response regulator